MTDEARQAAMRQAQARIGQVLRGKWRLDGVLGIGGMAAVYAATHRNAKRGAVKLLDPLLSKNDDVRQRFLREGYVANRVEHPGAVSVLDDDIAEDGSVYLVMELLDGEPVGARAERSEGGRLPLAETLWIADALLDVLASAHDKGIVHRDIKPDNLFLTRRGEVKVLDFGIARLREPSQSVAVTVGGPLGSPAFMPPEQARGDWNAVDARSDVWAAGATIFTLLTGRYVHRADNAQSMLFVRMTTPAPSLGEVVAGLPMEIVRIIDRALAFEQRDRWQNAREMQAALRSARDSVFGAPRSRTGAPAMAPLPAELAPAAGPSADAPPPGEAPAQPSAVSRTRSAFVRDRAAGADGAPAGGTIPPARSRRRIALGAAAAFLAVAGLVGVVGLSRTRGEPPRSDPAASGSGSANADVRPAPAETAPAQAEARAPAASAAAIESGLREDAADAPPPPAAHPSPEPAPTARPAASAPPGPTAKPKAVPPSRPTSNFDPFSRRE
ncbi:protein kinase [Sorangium sp. So ce367]|uniref:serine/threonine-protein kinase n=1 Tax=Sorangium sp. So ce367 TaxID=3133305 RepID=UPI003F605318